MYDAAVQEGIPENPDYNSGSVEGVGWMQLTVRDDKRVSTWRAYMKPALDHPGLTLITGGHVRRLLVDGTTVTGAEVTVDGQRLECRADEVVLCGGTFGSAELLLRSGIGPAEALLRPVAAAQGWVPATQAGVLLGFVDALIADDPGVADRLHAHLAEVSADTGNADPGEMNCRECGEPMFIAAEGTSHHVGDTMDGIDHGRDRDHTALLDRGA